MIGFHETRSPRNHGEKFCGNPSAYVDTIKSDLSLNYVYMLCHVHNAFYTFHFYVDFVTSVPFLC